ncbi:inactive peptidyl-prolyl cis-trans isomerase shutdown [Tribolium castaneum]|uniref:peptidylprolyl isomerase n=1 Tax=Tribolium castaneum TaxID=7070 RepID=D6WGT4_TRICA|nr:PREDICTED: inactive peptidyl-prolyl cis-trans isomerase shutdown [Tribolium castaneum]EEZ99628.1 Inactive peptidyl-prolyl cis-trans isomerase shutdown-like Protein [Tribolium castaneum]|eukprot:XP_969074.1 PREDICTED: inactive peptidyl-prolyl cis-trans isomerase shutdown [Tribolium castaneum]
MTETEIVGGLRIGDLVEDGAFMELKLNPPPEDHVQEAECTEALQQYLKLECLDLDKPSYDGEEPFTAIAKDMTNLLQNGKIKKKIIREGYGPTADNLSTVKINYNAYVQFEAQPFDSTYARKSPFTFTVGQGEVIYGLDLAVQSMKINEKAQFLIDPELAYRDSGLNRIPPNSVVLFEVELCEVKETLKNRPEVNEREFKHVYPQCVALCAKGKDMVRLKDYQGAIKQYTTSANKLEEAILENYEEQLKCEELMVRLYTNLLVCCTHAEIPKRGCIFAQKIYEMAKNGTFKVSAKVYFNHAKCQRMLGAYKQAERNFQQAKALEPGNEEISKELAILKKAKEEYNKQQAKFAKALLK